jgi:phenylpropionate dioxygenase-like ring-hydroxylating dioxygenase large terminal subunit
MLKNFWYAVEFSSAITDKPRPITLMGESLVVYRTAGDNKVIAMSDWCAHRGARLSDGWRDGDCIRCPYHGWKYQPDGRCIEIPANPFGIPVPRKARVQAYPAVDRYGWVWLFMGDLPEADRPPIPTLAHFDDPGMRVVRGEFRWQAHYTHVVENSVDISHLPWVHNQSIGHLNEETVAPYKTHDEDWGASATIARERPPGKKWLWNYLGRNSRNSPHSSVSFGFHMPNVTRMEARLPFATFCVYGAHVPIDDRTTVTKWAALRSFLTGAWADFGTRRRTIRIYEEDRKVVESQRIVLPENELDAEVHVKSDYVQIAYRKLRKKCRDRGWRLETSSDNSVVRCS